jgi:prepilin-type N-terminal cleavage/methylation domain-containing protein
MNARRGFTLVETCIVVAIVGLLAAIAIPSFGSVRAKCMVNTKKANLRMLNHAVELWAMDNLAGDNDRIGSGITNYLRGGLESMKVGNYPLDITNITQRTVGYTFTIDDLY